MDYPVGHVSEHGVVGDENGERAEVEVHALNGFEHGDARFHIERAGRLVAKQHLGPLRNRPRNGHALLLAAGHLRGKVVHAIREFDERERGFRRHRVARDLGDERDVLPPGEAGDEIVKLENEPDGIAPEAREFVLVRTGKVVAAIGERAVGRRVESAEDVEERGFSRAGCAEQDDEFAAVKIEIDAVQRADFRLAARVNFRQPARREKRFARGPAGRRTWRLAERGRGCRDGIHWAGVSAGFWKMSVSRCQ